TAMQAQTAGGALGAAHAAVVSGPHPSAHSSSSSNESPSTTHMQRTAAVARDRHLHSAVITRVATGSSAVRLLRLAVARSRSDDAPACTLVAGTHSPSFAFQAGQWVDFHIPGEAVVGASRL